MNVLDTVCNILSLVPDVHTIYSVSKSKKQQWNCSNVLIISDSYWGSQLIIALIRYLMVKYPIAAHNALPTNNCKNVFFLKLLT